VDLGYTYGNRGGAGEVRKRGLCLSSKPLLLFLESPSKFLKFIVLDVDAYVPEFMLLVCLNRGTLEEKFAQ